MITPFRASAAAVTMGLLALAGTLHVAPLAATATGEAPICDPGGPYGCYLLRTFEFDGRRSYDPDGTIVSYTWDFGDGHSAAGAVVAHRYESVGNYITSLVVVDNDGLPSLCQILVPISEPCPQDNCPPVCDEGGPYSGVVGIPVQFDGSRSSSPFLCIPIVYYAWSFGDGATGVGPQPTHTYSTPGWYDVQLTITDADGASSSCLTTAVISEPSSVEPTTWGRLKRALFK